MTAHEIRETRTSGERQGSQNVRTPEALNDCAQFLREIAAQLAEINERAADAAQEGEANGG